MKSWFCESKGLPGVVKALVYAAGMAVGRNNPDLASKSAPVAQAILAAMEKGTDNAALNAMLAEAVKALVERVSGDPAIRGAMELALADLKIDIPAGTFPQFGNDEISDMIKSFVSGMGSVSG